MFSNRIFLFMCNNIGDLFSEVSPFRISINLAMVESSLVELCLRDFGPIGCCLLFGCVELDFGRAASLDNGAVAAMHQLTLSGR